VQFYMGTCEVLKRETCREKTGTLRGVCKGQVTGGLRVWGVLLHGSGQWTEETGGLQDVIPKVAVLARGLLDTAESEAQGAR
jgi:hypothetical protein